MFLFCPSCFPNRLLGHARPRSWPPFRTRLGNWPSRLLFASFCLVCFRTWYAHPTSPLPKTLPRIRSPLGLGRGHQVCNRPGLPGGLRLVWLLAPSTSAHRPMMPGGQMCGNIFVRSFAMQRPRRRNLARSHGLPTPASCCLASRETHGHGCFDAKAVEPVCLLSSVFFFLCGTPLLTVPGSPRLLHMRPREPVHWSWPQHP